MNNKLTLCICVVIKDIPIHTQSSIYLLFDNRWILTHTLPVYFCRSKIGSYNSLAVEFMGVFFKLNFIFIKSYTIIN